MIAKDSGIGIQKVAMEEPQPLQLSKRYEVFATCVDESRDYRENEQTNYGTADQGAIYVSESKK